MPNTVPNTLQRVTQTLMALTAALGISGLIFAVTLS